jgi:hypothetical protein
VDDLEKFERELSSLTPLKVPERLETAIAEAMERPPRRWRRAWFAAAAALLLSAGVGTIVALRTRSANVENATARILHDDDAPSSVSSERALLRKLPLNCTDEGIVVLSGGGVYRKFSRRILVVLEKPALEGKGKIKIWRIRRETLLLPLKPI